MSKCAWIRIVVLGLALAAMTPTARAALRHNRPVDGTVLDCSRPSIASAYWMWLTAWEEGAQIASRFDGIVELPGSGRDSADDISHGPGAMPETGILPDGTFILAFVRGEELVVREQPGFADWTTVAVASLGASVQATSRIDLWCSPDPEFPASAWLAIWSGSPTESGIRFLRRTAAGWEPVQTVPGTVSTLMDLSCPQVTSHDGPTGPLPRIYFNDLDEGPTLMHVDLQSGGGWSAPVAHVGVPAFGGEFDVARRPGGYVFLSAGLQPTCPCNTISFCEWSEDGGWLPPLPLTAHTDAYDWPQSPRIGVDGRGRVHALWYQLGSDDAMTPRHRRLYYRQRDGGTWADHGDGLSDQQDMGLDSHLAMSVESYLDEAAFAWTRRDTVAGEPQAARVWESLADYASLYMDVVPLAVLHVTAAPNPFNPSVELSAISERPLVAVEIFDTRGARVAVLTPAPDSGAWRAVWDGRDGRGRALPSGAYLARVRDETGATASCKVVLAR